jgi:hypothetical protein
MSESHLEPPPSQEWTFLSSGHVSSSLHNENDVFGDVVPWMDAPPTLNNRDEEKRSLKTTALTSMSPKCNDSFQTSHEQRTYSFTKSSNTDFPEPDPRSPNFIITHGSRDTLLLLCEVCNQYSKGTWSVFQ